MVQHILLYGHSYIRHLRNFVRNTKLNNLSLDVSDIHVHMVSGLSKFDKINLIGDAKARVTQTLQRLPPINVVLILLGTNDLCQFPEKGGKEIAG